MQAPSERVMIWRAAPGPNGDYLIGSGRLDDGNRALTLTDDPACADWIIVTELDPRRPLAVPGLSQWRRKKPTQIFAFSTDDYIVPWLPGVYAAIDRRLWLPDRMWAGFYPCRVTGLLQIPPSTGTETWLASFVGNVATHPVRRALCALRAPGFLVRDNVARGVAEATQYRELLTQSAFVLCPRGNGTGSIRLFETMAAGRVPVVIADNWVPPPEPDWPTFSLRISESDVAKLPGLLEEARGRAPEMGRLARAAWLRWFAPEQALPTVIAACRVMRARTSNRGRMHGWLGCLRYYTHPFYLRRHLLPALGWGVRDV